METVTAIVILNSACLDGGVGEKMSMAFSITENTLSSASLLHHSLRLLHM